MRTSKRSLSDGIELHDRRTRLADGEGDGALVVVVDGASDIEAAHGRSGLSEVVRVAGQRIRLTLRAHDFTARWGGEDLIVVLRNVSIDQTVEVGQRIRMALAQPIKLHDGESVVATCAIGAAAGDPERIEALIQRAHLALELAKRSGGNCVRRSLPAEDRWTAGALAVG